MALRDILLGMLARPASGYDLKRQFNQSLRHFWAAELAQIYPTLQRLERDGLLEVSVEPSPQGPERKVYRRRKPGSKQVRQWLAQGPEFRRDRISYLAQVYFLHELDDRSDQREFLVELRDRIAEQLGELRDVERHWRENDPRYPDELPDEDFFPQLTLQLGLERLAASLHWCEQSIVRLDRRS
ncbi:MAG: PadR family transcriptional regulator [Gammaproteobacteria bacterium]|nr:PadR family transcriptional regulator [Gammaproteobacteria bacterium]NNF61589.1 PadR family transcriptional regulator [Gammaproteobacteria bacterium]